MLFVKPSVELWEQENTFDGMLRHIERCGRVAYKSEDKATDDSAEKFVSMLKGRGHLSPLEHGTIYLSPDIWNHEDADDLDRSPYKKEFLNNVMTNYRVIVENGLEDLLDGCMIGNNELVELNPDFRRLTFHITCSRGISHELVRHRVFSFTQESTRYCNYSKDKFGKEITCIIPSWLDDIENGTKFDHTDIDPITIQKTLEKGEHSPFTMLVVAANVAAELSYMQMLEFGKTPQEARDVLPNGLKTEVVMTGSIEQWKGFLKLRSPECEATGVHPDMAHIANEIYYIMLEKGYIKEESDGGESESPEPLQMVEGSVWD